MNFRVYILAITAFVVGMVELIICLLKKPKDCQCSSRDFVDVGGALYPLCILYSVSTNDVTSESIIDKYR